MANGVARIITDTREETAPNRVESGQRAERRLAHLGPVFKQALQLLASLRLTVTLFALSIFLVFAGTLVQVDKGIWIVMEDHFRTFWTTFEFQVFFPRDIRVAGWFPFPGGWLLGALLLLNLIAAHSVRFKFSWKRSGILLIHAGLIIMLLSELVTGLYANEGRMIIEEGQATNWVEDGRSVELAVIDPSDPEVDRVTAVPQSFLRASLATGEPIRDDRLPFDIRIDRYLRNSDPVDAARSQSLSDYERQFAFPLEVRTGQVAQIALVERPEVTGTEEQVDNRPAAYATFLHPETGEQTATHLLGTVKSQFQIPAEVEHDGTTYHVYLRFKRTYRPYTMHLYDFTHEQYLGTGVARNYASHIRLTHPERGVDREVLIYMNHPLRYEGETFFQASFLQDNSGTILQVVRNPGWTMPYIALILVGSGLLIHFGMSLTTFVRKRAAR